MSGRGLTTSEDARLPELQSLVASADDGRVAVLRDGELVGVVTRSGLLRELEGVEPRPETPEESVADELEPIARLRPVFDAVAALGDRAEGVFLVGGTLRDILLGEENFDVDIAVEGDAISVARVLAATEIYVGMTTERADRLPFSPSDAAAELRRLESQGVLEPRASRAVLVAAGHGLPQQAPRQLPAPLGRYPRPARGPEHLPLVGVEQEDLVGPQAVADGPHQRVRPSRDRTAAVVQLAEEAIQRVPRRLRPVRRRR